MERIVAGPFHFHAVKQHTFNCMYIFIIQGVTLPSSLIYCNRKSPILGVIRANILKL
jgi:hypothetical protein